jgi:hypothetical protein
MVKLSVSKAARMLGISRFDIQNQINNGKKKDPNTNNGQQNTTQKKDPNTNNGQQNTTQKRPKENKERKKEPFHQNIHMSFTSMDMILYILYIYCLIWYIPIKFLRRCFSSLQQLSMASIASVCLEAR